ncbi:MAG: ABC transporter substrate-binding protein [Spirochaetae bacterium HGW-Spirochaetae-2]|jgi:tripartite ATP-independent transporter DctP family solute receptor|nr:MAG: ABC transporter substrate-binding protein [Spirochaetae bacterium HGW-Spirochaetae-2]
MKKKVLLLALIAVMSIGMVASVFAQGSQEVAGKTLEIKLGHVYDPSHPWHAGAVKASEVAKELSNGRININVFPAGQLGTEPELLEQVLLGSLDASIAGAGQVGTLYSPFNVLEMPYTFRNNAHVLAFTKSDLGQSLFEGFRKKFGGRIVGASTYGIRQMTSSKLVRTPADLAGFKLRVPEQTVTMAYAKAMGANPTPIAFSEVYMALQQGVVDGQENPMSVINAQKFYEVQKYVILTSHVTNATFFVMNDAIYSALSAADKDILAKAFEEAAQHIVNILDSEDNNLKTKFAAAGVEVITPDIEAFRKATASMPKDFSHWWAAEYGADFHTKIQNLK